MTAAVTRGQSKSSHRLPSGESMAKLNQALADKLKLPQNSTDHIEWDDAVKGFGLRIREGGNKSWIFQYKLDGNTRRIKLGTTQELTAEQARKGWKGEDGQWRDGAAKLKNDADRGEDVAVKRLERRASAAQRFKAVLDEYLEVKGPTLRPRTLVEVKRHLEVNFGGLHSRQIDDITKGHVSTELEKIIKTSGASSANRARASLNAFFRWAFAKDRVKNNPVIGTEKQKENYRQRVLTDNEAAAFWLAADPETQFGRIVRLLMLTGCRRDEIGSLRWSEIDLEAKTITLPKERTKNKTEHLVPLCDTAVNLLETTLRVEGREFVFGVAQGGFAGWSRSKILIDERAGLKTGWTLHDLRRTVRTGLDLLSVQPHVSEAVLNHLQTKLMRTYNLNTYAKEKREALNTWANHLLVAVAKANGANVTTLRKA
jgi:integrase